MFAMVNHLPVAASVFMFSLSLIHTHTHIYIHTHIIHMMVYTMYKLSNLFSISSFMSHYFPTFFAASCYYELGTHFFSGEFFFNIAKEGRL